MRRSGRYDFWDEWHLRAQAPVVWEVVHRVEAWPTWWPSVLRVDQIAAGDGDGAGAVFRFVFQTRLPYRMSFQARVLRVDRRGVETVVAGRVEGSGRWDVRPDGDGCAVLFRWSVHPRVRWMRLLSPLARPVFVWNHRALMREGGEALARHLGTVQSAPASGGPGVAGAALQVAAVVGGSAVGVAALRRSRRGRARPTYAVTSAARSARRSSP